jgi:chemotaxis protein MotC
MNPAARLRRLVGVALVAVLLPASAHAQGPSALQPYQMVRSLQVVQDRIAGGDYAIMPMQRKLLEMIDARFRTGSKDDFADTRNLRALLVYAMSGGNPATIRVVLSRLNVDGPDSDIGKGVQLYMNGRIAEARSALGAIDPLTLPVDLGAFVALVKGSVIADDPQAAMKLYDQARLLGPGTLVEEGALRRTVALAATSSDATRFALAATQYAERYLSSPYASQFADAFVSGVVALHETLDTATLSTITALMDAEQERVIYLRIARRAGIDGLTELSTFASAKAEDSERNPKEVDDPRALLYSSLASISSGTSDEIGAKLARIDRYRLSQSDRELFDAVANVATKLTGAPPAMKIEPVSQPAPVEMPEDEEQPVVEAAATPLPAPQKTAPLPQAASAAVEAAAAVTEQADNVVIETRRKLDEIDKLLGNVQ